MARKTPADRICNAGYAAFVAAGIVWPLLAPEDGKEPGRSTLRTVEALTASYLLVTALKQAIPERRPDSPHKNSFPSKHTMNAFAVAAMRSRCCVQRGPLWYAGAALIGIGRVAVGRHRMRDVLAGALFGHGVARAELATRDGFVLPPPRPGRRPGPARRRARP